MQSRFGLKWMNDPSSNAKNFVFNTKVITIILIKTWMHSFKQCQWGFAFRNSTKYNSWWIDGPDYDDTWQSEGIVKL